MQKKETAKEVAGEREREEKHYLSRHETMTSSFRQSGRASEILKVVLQLVLHPELIWRAALNYVSISTFPLQELSRILAGCVPAELASACFLCKLLTSDTFNLSKVLLKADLVLNTKLKTSRLLSA